MTSGPSVPARGSAANRFPRHRSLRLRSGASRRVARSNPRRDVERIKKLVWLYFWLLIFEGALRKWVVPSLSTVLLVVRDPVVVLIYLLAIRARLFPRSALLVTLGFIALPTLATGLLAPDNTIGTALYGFRTNFLHLPLIFVMARVLDAQDIRKIGYWTLVLSIPLAILMALQFSAPPTSIINSGLAGDFEQISGARDHIRPPATFSFVTGPIFFFGMVAAVLLNAPFAAGTKETRFPAWLLVASSGALLLAMAVSISRSLVINVGLVFIAAFVATLFLRPRLAPRWILVLAALALAGFAGSDSPLLQEGVGSLVDRTEGAAEGKGAGTDLTGRVAEGFTDPVSQFNKAPFWGYGLGIGTNGGAALLGDNAPFISQEGEWTRNLLESGPLLGGSFIIWRICLTLALGWESLRRARLGNVLPLLIYAIAGPSLLSGILPQPTALGFTMFLGGLCLASAKAVENEAEPKPDAAKSDSRRSTMRAPKPRWRHAPQRVPLARYDALSARRQEHQQPTS